MERVFKTELGKELHLRRPSFKTFKNIAAKVSALMELELPIAMSTDEFTQVLQACTVENIDEWLGEADYEEAAKLWDAIIEHCEFEEFFAVRQSRHFEASKARMEWDAQLQAAQVEAMKNSGLLPRDFSLSDALTMGMNPLENPMTLPSLSTITPAGTDGAEGKSSEKTSGTSSETTPSPSNAGRRKRG